MIRFQPANAQHVGSRENQQDSFGFSDFANAQFAAHGGVVAIVCDGMGGLAMGDQASRLAVKVFLEAYATKTESESIPEALERSTRSANAAVVELATAAGTPGEVGTTLVAVVFLPEGIYWISVGDSGLFLYRNGQLTQVNSAHVYANILDVRAYRGEITREQAVSDPQREALTSYVGSRELKEIDANVRPMPVQHGDNLVLASDGLFKTLSFEQIKSILGEYPESSADKLVERTIGAKRQYQDNVTVCSVRVIDAAYVAAVAAPPVTKVLAETQEMPAAPRGSQKRFLTGFFAAAIAVACLAIGGFFAYQRFFAPKPAVVAQPGPAPGGDETAQPLKASPSKPAPSQPVPSQPGPSQPAPREPKPVKGSVAATPAPATKPADPADGEPPLGEPDTKAKAKRSRKPVKAPEPDLSPGK